MRYRIYTGRYAGTKKIFKKMYKIHSGGAKRPHPAEGRVWILFILFVDFPCAVCGFPAYLLACILYVTSIYLYDFGVISIF